MTFFDISRFSEKGFLASKGPSNTVVGLFRDVLGFVYMIYVSILVLVRLGLQIPSGCRNTLETSLKNVILTNFSPNTKVTFSNVPTRKEKRPYCIDLLLEVPLADTMPSIKKKLVL